MRTISRYRIYDAPAHDVFNTIDDLGVTGTHMTESSMMMMGNKLRLTYLTSQRTGLNSKYRWQGKMMGLPMDFTVLVTKWVANKEKIWETIGESKLIIYSGYRMSLKVASTSEGTVVSLSIAYERPKGFWQSILSFLFADLYCIWCLNKMLNDAERALKTKQLHLYSI